MSQEFKVNQTGILGKPVPYIRRYRHLCPAKARAEQQIEQKYCPDCNQEGEFIGWAIPIYTRILRRYRLFEMPGEGPHLTYLPEFWCTCTECKGEGILMGPDFDYECPECEGLGGKITLDPQGMQKIQRWAKRYRSRGASGCLEKSRATRSYQLWKPYKGKFSDKTVKTIFNGLKAQNDYWEKYRVRNRCIGQLVLPCDDHGWDIFMELVEVWEQTGHILDVSPTSILLRAATPTSPCLLSIYPPEDEKKQSMHIHLDEIEEQFGMKAGKKARIILKTFNSTLDGWIVCNEQFSLENAWELLLLLHKLAKQATG
jgi:hypothetical protein